MFSVGREVDTSMTWSEDFFGMSRDRFGFRRCIAIIRNFILSMFSVTPFNERSVNTDGVRNIKPANSLHLIIISP